MVTSEFPFLGASPDGKVCDAGQYGILEIKCPYASRNSTTSESCDLRNFCLEKKSADSTAETVSCLLHAGAWPANGDRV